MLTVASMLSPKKCCAKFSKAPRTTPSHEIISPVFSCTRERTLKANRYLPAAQKKQGSRAADSPVPGSQLLISLPCVHTPATIPEPLRFLNAHTPTIPGYG